MKKLLLVTLIGVLGLSSDVFAVRTDPKGTGANTARARQQQENAERERDIKEATRAEAIQRNPNSVRQSNNFQSAPVAKKEIYEPEIIQKSPRVLVNNDYSHSEGEAEEYTTPEWTLWDNVLKPYLQSKGYIAQSEQPVIEQPVQKEPTVEIVSAPVVVETSKGLTDNQYAALGATVAVTAAVAVTYGGYKLARWAYNKYNLSGSRA